MNITHLPETQCPGCHFTINAGAPSDPRKAIPKPGNLTLCFYCGMLLEFQKDFSLAQISQKEWNKLSANERAGIIRQRDKLPFRVILTTEWRYSS